jgi:uncharacterized protein (DUF1501 family)
MNDPVSTRCTECEELELARVRDELPSQTLPLPTAALEGLPEGRDSRDITRRRLLQGGLAGFASVYGSKLLGFEEVFEAAVAEAAAPAGPCLVLLYLAGGNDGLNVLLPGTGAATDLAAYQAARPTIGRTIGAGATGAADVPGTGSAMAWANVVTTAQNGSAYGFDTLWGAGDGGAGSDLAMLPAVDYTPANLSHFDSSDLWFAGSLSAMTTGWLGRWVDRNGSALNPLQAISLDTALSKAIRTSVNPVCAIPSTSNMGFSLRSTGWGLPAGNASNADFNAQMAALGALAAGPQNAYLARARSSYGQAVQVAGSAATITGQPATVPVYPAGSGLSTKLKLAAKILSAGLGTRIITIHWGGFDTHGDQLAVQDPQLKVLSAALGAFRADLAARGIEQNVVTLAFSEFGRRVAENGTGTDHGAGGLMLASGSAVRGGLAGEFPGCAPGNLDANGNLKVATDFRSVFQSVLTDWLGGDLTGVLPGGPFPALVRQDGGSSLIG